MFSNRWLEWAAGDAPLTPATPSRAMTSGLHRAPAHSVRRSSTPEYYTAFYVGRALEMIKAAMKVLKIPALNPRTAPFNWSVLIQDVAASSGDAVAPAAVGDAVAVAGHRTPRPMVPFFARSKLPRPGLSVEENARLCRRSIFAAHELPTSQHWQGVLLCS